MHVSESILTSIYNKICMHETLDITSVGKGKFIDIQMWWVTKFVTRKYIYFRIKNTHLKLNIKIQKLCKKNYMTRRTIYVDKMVSTE